MDFSEKVALVTGGGAGIGRATAMAFAKRGARVAVVDRDESGGTDTVARIGALGGVATFIRADMASPDDIESMVTQTVSRFGRLDYAHNNAAIVGGHTDAVACTQAEWAQVMAINLTGVWLAMKFEIAAMLSAGGGAIVNTSSVGGIGAASSSVAYIAAKHGVIGLTRSAAADFGAQGIRVNALVPGAVDTAMLAPAMSGAKMAMDAMTARTPLRRIGQPEEQANAVVWLCSPDASFVTGTTMVVDGGQTIMV